MKRIINYFLHIFNIYRLNLYSLNSCDELPELVSNVEYSFMPITLDNYRLISTISDESTNNFKKMLSYNDFGLYIIIGGKPVGYGWVKQDGSKDPFYRFNMSCYLCRFYIHPDYRGKNLYPITIKRLVEMFRSKYKNIYISVAPDNVPSIRGVNKLSFRKRGSFTFVRFLKVTFNKYTISDEI